MAPKVATAGASAASDAGPRICWLSRPLLWGASGLWCMNPTGAASRNSGSAAASVWVQGWDGAWAW